MSSFAAVIGYQLPGEKYKTIVLDTIEDTQVSGSARVTEQPIVTGDVIADHMFNEPKTMSIHGQLSMSGSKVTIIDGEGSKLANFQDLIESIQREGVKCNITKLSMKNENDIRFLYRDNMVIQNFSWSERINSLSFTLQFREVLSAEVVSYDVDTDDAYLPNINEPITTSFTDTLIDWNAIDEQIVKILLNNKLLSVDFLTMMKSLGEDMLKSLVPAAIAASLALIMAACASNPVGWVVAAIGAAIYSAYLFVKAFVNLFRKISNRAKYKVEAFKLDKENQKKNESEVKRFSTFIESIHNSLQKINSLIHVYKISTNEPQESMISVGSEYYIFTFTKNNVANTWSLKLDNLDTNVANMPDIHAAPTDFGKLTNADKLTTAANNSTIYLMYNPIVNESENQDTKEADNNDLRQYMIVVCDFDVEKYQKLLEDLIVDQIVYS